jgi:hypothetical protein
MRQADMILRSAEDSVPEANDLEDIRQRPLRLDLTSKPGQRGVVVTQVSHDRSDERPVVWEALGFLVTKRKVKGSHGRLPE